MLSDLISEETLHRIHHFVDKVFLPRAVMIRPSVPAAMVDGSPNSDGWVPWKAIESPVTDEDISLFEGNIGATLPPLFRAYLMYKCLLMTDFGIVRLPEIPADYPLEPFGQLLGLLEDNSNLRHRRLVPFAQDGNDAGPLCFDVGRRLPDGDCPVLLMDHELYDQPDYSGLVLAGSFAELLDRIEKDMLSFE
jgi:hypothetical protein